MAIIYDGVFSGARFLESRRQGNLYSVDMKILYYCDSEGGIEGFSPTRLTSEGFFMVSTQLIINPVEEVCINKQTYLKEGVILETPRVKMSCLNPDKHVSFWQPEFAFAFECDLPADQLKHKISKKSGLPIKCRYGYLMHIPGEVPLEFKVIESTDPIALGLDRVKINQGRQRCVPETLPVSV